MTYNVFGGTLNLAQLNSINTRLLVLNYIRSKSCKLCSFNLAFTDLPAVACDHIQTRCLDKEPRLNVM